MIDQSDTAQLQAENARLRQQLQRTSDHLALLSAVNHRLTAASSLDEILDAAPLLPQQLIPAYAAALVLIDHGQPILARTSGTGSFTVEPQHSGQLDQRFQPPRPHVTLEAGGSRLTLPLHDGQALVGWIELLRHSVATPPDDELGLLATMAGEIAEAISGARRRTREALAIYALERAITEERARIARDVHDGIAQTLAFQRMRIDLWLDWISSEPDRLRNELVELKQVLRDQIADLRRAIFALRPIQFDQFGFEVGLQRYVAEFAEQQGWQITIDLSRMAGTLPHELEGVSFRIVQEALTNVAKHASASSVAVVLEQAASELHLLVRDDGRGFDLADRLDQQPGHVGLRQIRERLAAIGGRFELRTQSGAGTDIQAWLPLDSQSTAETPL